MKPCVVFGGFIQAFAQSTLDDLWKPGLTILDGGEPPPSWKDATPIAGYAPAEIRLRVEAAQAQRMERRKQ